MEGSTAALLRFVPRVASEWDVVAPRCQWQAVDSTLCFVDLSGFTSLSERLARRGRIGAEELTDVLDRVFGRMLEIAYQRGGTLLKFGGDALLLHFAVDDHPAQAACAAVEMREALRGAARIPTSVGRVALRMSVGIHSGTVHMFRVGVTHRELIVTGPAATEVAAMESAADAGEILLSPGTAARLPKHALGEAKGPGILLRWRRAPLAPTGASPRRHVSNAAIAECLPAVLRQALLSGGGVEPEHRVATVGFIKFEGIDVAMAEGGPDAAAAALHQLIRTVQEETEINGVTMLATDVDKNGGKVILTTGVPAAQDDDAGRMMRALRAIADAGTTLPLRVGVHRGHVFAGAVGGPHRATFTVIGDSVNLAARLMAASAPGELFATPAALDRSRTLFQTEAMAPLSVRGKSELVHAYKVGAELGPRTGGSDMLPFVGRSAELATLTAAIANARQGSGAAIGVSGGTGVGKSRLLGQALAAAGGMTLFTVRAEHAGSTAAYRAFRDPIRELLGIGRDAASVMAQRLHDVVASRSPELLPMLPLLGDVAHIDVPSTAAVDSIELRFRPDRTADAVAGLLAAMTGGPMVVVVEDAQWMDTASASVIARLATRTRHQPWVMIAVRRPEPGGATPTLDLTIELEPLDPQLAADAVVGATSAAPLRPHEIAAIVARAGGNPLFLSELVRMSRGSRVEDLPDSLGAVINAEVDALGPLARRLLRMASVLGGSFRVAVLAEVLAAEQITLDDATTHELGRFLEYEGTDRVRFRHALLRETAYQGLAYRRRRELHLRAGLVTERLAGDSPDSVADVMAAHFSLAHDHGRAWKYALIAGNRARDRYANVEAVAQYERALEAARRLGDVPSDQVVAVWTALGDVREQLGLFDEALEAFRRASGLVRGDAITGADLLWRRARTRMHLGAYRTALAEASRARRMLVGLEEPSASAVRARLSALQALLRQAQQRAGAALVLAERAVQEAGESDDGSALARAYLVIDWAKRVQGATGAGYGELALEIYERLGDLDGAGKASNNLGAIAYFDGRWEDAVNWYRRALDFYRRCGNDAAAAVAGGNLAELLVSQRAFEEAEAMLRDSIRVLRSSRALDDVLFAEIQLGRLFVERGDYATALDHLELVRFEAAGLGQVGYAFEASMYWASTLVSIGRFDDAVRMLDDAAASVGFVDPLYQPTLSRVRASALAHIGRVEEAHELINFGLASASEQGMLYEEALLRAARIEIAQLAGDQADPGEVAAMRAIFSRLDVPVAGDGQGEGRDAHPVAV
jgi:class 3 adenylate cyclase/tetratricopeptide (TPR) repeat protein